MDGGCLFGFFSTGYGASVSQEPISEALFNKIIHICSHNPMKQKNRMQNF